MRNFACALYSRSSTSRKYAHEGWSFSQMPKPNTLSNPALLALVNTVLPPYVSDYTNKDYTFVKSGCSRYKCSVCLETWGLFATLREVQTQCQCEYVVHLHCLRQLVLSQPQCTLQYAAVPCLGCNLQLRLTGPENVVLLVVMNIRPNKAEAADRIALCEWQRACAEFLAESGPSVEVLAEQIARLRRTLSFLEEKKRVSERTEEPPAKRTKRFVEKALDNIDE